MNCAPTPTTAAATMAAAAVPAAGCTRRRLRVERPALTVVIVFLHMRFRLGMYLKTARRGQICRRRWPPNWLRRTGTPAWWLAGMLVATPSEFVDCVTTHSPSPDRGCPRSRYSLGVCAVSGAARRYGRLTWLTVPGLA